MARFRSKPTAQQGQSPIKAESGRLGDCGVCLDVIQFKAGKSRVRAVSAARTRQGRYGGHGGCSREELRTTCFAARDQVEGRARTVHDVQEPGRTRYSGEVRLVLHADDLVICRGMFGATPEITEILSVNDRLVKKPAPVTGARIR